MIYGRDHRKDFQEVAASLQNDADSVVLVVKAAAVIAIYGRPEEVMLKTNAFTSLGGVPISPDERFYGQPFIDDIGVATGVLLAPDVVALAGHSLAAAKLEELRFVFGFRMQRNEAGTIEAQTILLTNEVYCAQSVIASEWDVRQDADWALVRLTRPVSNHRPAQIRRKGQVASGQAVHLIGHPLGLPLKIATDGTVFESANPHFAAQTFETNLDAFPGNSGSPVFNSETHELEGILSKVHARHFEWKRDEANRSYLASKIYPQDTTLRQICTRVTAFSDRL